MKTQKIIIEIKSEIKNEEFINKIAEILQKEKLVCNMSYYEGINRTEYLNENDN